jgi:uncharacterized protein YjiS (DUF1127 family)
MEQTMASTPITYHADPDPPASHGVAAAAARKLAAFAWALSAWFGAAAARCVHSLADELRIRRDTRQLMAMSDEMLKDIGLTRAEIGGAVRYGRE